MINLEPYSEDCYVFYSNIVAAKYNKRGDPEFKNRLLTLNSDIKKSYKLYSDLLNRNELKTITPLKLVDQNKSDLLSIYRFKSSAIQELFVLLTTKGKRKFNTCQMCTIGPAGSFDHVVPKEMYPEYIVDPINLFPCCLTCNGKKGEKWVKNGERIFLNLYYDILPNVEYLKIDFDPYPIPIYTIDGSLLPDEDFLVLLKSHYNELDLFKRFRENSSEYIDEVVTLGKSMVPKIGIGEYRKLVEESTLEMLSIYGVNHWKSLLKLALVNHDDFGSLLT